MPILAEAVVDELLATPLSKGLRQVLSQSFGGCGEDGGEDAALVVVTNASSVAMSLPKGLGGCRVSGVG